jgi:uncharacterized protein (DUF488 family)
MSVTVYTIGHSRHAAAPFVRLLGQHGIAVLADVRSVPASRFSPHFKKAALDELVRAAGIEYVFLGKELGGRPAGGTLDYALRAEAPDFRAGIDRLLVLAGRARTAILCAEEDPTRCHRRLLVTPALLARGAAVEHIRGDGRIEREAEPSQRELF